MHHKEGTQERDEGACVGNAWPPPVPCRGGLPSPPLLRGGRPMCCTSLPPDALPANAPWPPAGAPAPVLRLRGGGGGGMSVTVQPRVQKDTWSLYWKESMSTKTDLLPPCDLALGEGATPADLLAALAAAQGWQPADKLLRLEGARRAEG